MLGRTEERQSKISKNNSRSAVCDVCGQNHDTESCLFICSRPCSVEDAVFPSRARLTLPANFMVRDLTDGTTTVVTQARFERGTRFGPYIAPLTSILPLEVNFPLKIFGKSEEDSYYLDTRNEDDCNWMCLVAPVSSSYDVQNLFCYQVHDKIFFSLLRDIEVGEELKVWYAPFYGVKMGIPPDDFMTLSSNSTQFPEVSESLLKDEEPVMWEADTTTADLPTEDTTADLPTEDTTADLPTEDTTADLPTEDTTADLPTEDTTADLPTEDTTADLPTEDTTADLLPEDTTTDLPTEDEPRMVTRSQNQQKDRRKNDKCEIDEEREIANKTKTALVAQQLPPKRLGARFTPACWRCRECGFKEDSVISYARHLMQHLKPPSARLKNFPCSLCHKKFFTQKLLGEHEVSRHGFSALLPSLYPEVDLIEPSVDDPLPMQQLTEKENLVKIMERAPNTFEKSSCSFMKEQNCSKSEPLMNVSCVSQTCNLEQLSRDVTTTEGSSALNNSLRNTVLNDNNVSTHDDSPTSKSTNMSETDCVMKSSSSIQENSERSEENTRKVIAVTSENSLQNPVIPIDPQKDINIQNLQQPSKEKPMLHCAKVPDTILNHEFFTRVAGDTIVRDVISLLSMGYSLQFFVENEDGSSSLVDVLSTGSSVTKSQVTSTSSGTQSGEVSSQQLVIMANGNVPEVLPLALQNILPTSVPIVSNVDPVVTAQSALATDASVESEAKDMSRTNDVQLTSCVNSDHSVLNKHESTSEVRSPLGTLLPTAVTGNMSYESIIPFNDSNSENASLMEMSLSGENLEREVLDYALNSLELPLAVEDSNCADFIINACSTPPRNTVDTDSLSGRQNTDLNTPVKFLNQCIEGTLSTDVMTFDFDAGSAVPPAGIVSSLQSEEKNSVCRDGLMKDFSDLIAADADNRNVLLTIQPADSTVELRKGCNPSTNELSCANEKNKSNTSLEWIEDEGLLLPNGSIDQVPSTIVLNINGQTTEEVCFESGTITNKAVELLKNGNNEEADLLRVTASEINAELNGLLDAHSSQCTSIANLQPHLQMNVKDQIQSSQLQPQANSQVLTQTNQQHWMHVNTRVSTPVETHQEVQAETQTLSQSEAQTKEQEKINQVGTETGVQGLSEPANRAITAEQIEVEEYQSFISSGPPFICDICYKSFEKVAYLYRHLRKHTGEFTCIACRAVFARKESLQLHECAAQPPRFGANSCKRLRCPFCPKQFVAKKQLTRHIANHSGTRHFQCPTCNRNFSSKEAAERHSQKCTSDSPSVNKKSSRQQIRKDSTSAGSTTVQPVLPLKCSLCGLLFLSQSGLERHKMTEHQDPSLHECSHCGRVMTLATPERMERHTRFCAPAADLQAGNVLAAVCPECNEPFRQLLLYRQHIFRHTHPFSCAHCQRVFRSLQEQGKHVCLDRLEQCCLCGHRFGTVSQLERHALTHGVPNYHCFECGRSFHQVNDFNQHRCFELSLKRNARKKVVESEDSSGTTLVSSTSSQNVNQSQHSESEKILICEICGDMCKSKRSLKAHLLLHGERKIVCPVCGKRFHRGDVLVEHMYVHEDPQLHCHICNKILKSKKTLDLHIRQQHSGNKQFICQQCGKGFHQKGNLRKHMRSHEPRGQPVSCPHCKRRFLFPESLAKHIPIHTEEPRFRCTQCDRSFVKEQMLRQHMKVHVSRGYSCPACGHTLKHRYSLRRHIIKHHPELTQEKKASSVVDHPEPTSENGGQSQGPEVLLTVSQLQLTTDGVRKIPAPKDIAIESACLLEESSMECSEGMVLYVLQEPLPSCLPLQESST